METSPGLKIPAWFPFLLFMHSSACFCVFFMYPFIQLFNLLFSVNFVFQTENDEFFCCLMMTFVTRSSTETHRFVIDRLWFTCGRPCSPHCFLHSWTKKMIESVIYFLLISKNNKCEHTCCHCFVCNVSSLTGWTGNQQLILDLLTDSFRVRRLMTLEYWQSGWKPCCPHLDSLPCDRTFKKSP